jgi:hypothetical protein
MAISSAATNLLGDLLPEWHLLLQGWSANGRLTAAAKEALLLNGEPQALTDLTAQWSAGEFAGLPPIVLLSAADINGALGAYAVSTGTIYLNADWLAGATKEQVIAVLTEELGHHLDGQLNTVDTPGDEGEYFARLLADDLLASQQTEYLRIQSDSGTAITGNGVEIPVETATAPAIRGNSLYAMVNGPLWTDAETQSVTLGGHLVALSSSDEEKFVVKYVESIDASRAWWWMGFGYDQTTNTFQWFNGEASNYTNWYEGSGLKYPDDAIVAGIYGYTEFTADPGRNWAGASIDQGQWAVSIPSSVRQGIAEIPLSLSINRQGEVKEGSGVFTTSINLSAGTQASGNLAEGAQVWWKISGITADDLTSGFLSGYGTITGGKLDIQHSLLQDDDTRESFEVSVFSDASMEGVYQIGTTATANIEEGIPDPLTGILDAPEKVKLRNKGKTKFILFGSDEIDVTRIDLRSLGFGNEADLVVNPSIKKNGRILASLEDENDDGIIDLRVKVDTSSLAAIIPRGTTDIRAFGQYGDGTELVFGLDVDESVLFY